MSRYHYDGQMNAHNVPLREMNHKKVWTMSPRETGAVKVHPNKQPTFNAITIHGDGIISVHSMLLVYIQLNVPQCTLYIQGLEC